MYSLTYFAIYHYSTAVSAWSWVEVIQEADWQKPALGCSLQHGLYQLQLIFGIVSNTLLKSQSTTSTLFPPSADCVIPQIIKFVRQDAFLMNLCYFLLMILLSSRYSVVGFSVFKMCFACILCWISYYSAHTSKFNYKIFHIIFLLLLSYWEKNHFLGF